jgi:hypothetical protein
MLDVLLLAAAVITAKVQPLTATLFESVEMGAECAKATDAESARDAALKAQVQAKARIEKENPPPKPFNEVTSDEDTTAWNKWKREQKRMIDEALAAIPVPRPSGASARTICAKAATAELSKGTELTVLEKKAPMTKVKVETGRSTGLVGWVLDADIAEPKKP